MSGRPIGTAFAEISLDSTKLEQGLKRTNDALMSGSIKVEDAYKSLGIKSDQVFDMMRANATAAVDFIKNKTLSSTAEIARAQEAAAAKIKSINEQQYGHQTTMIEGLKKNWIAATAAVAVAVVAANKAMQYMEEGAKALAIESSFKIMADSSGVAADSMIVNMKRATKETIDDSQMMQKAIKLMTLGYNPEQIERFSKIVITASQIAGTSAAEAYDNLADAIANRAPKALIKMGGITKEQMKIVTAAIEAGADSMALFELAMANLEVKQKMLQGTQNEATLAMQRFKAEAEETTENIGKGLIWALHRLYGVFQAVAAGAMTLVAGLLKIGQGWHALKGLITFGEESKLNKALAADYAKDAADMMGAATELAKKSQDNIMGTAEVSAKASKQEISDAKEVVDAQVARLKAIADAAKGAKDVFKAESDANKKLYEQEIEMADHAARMRVLAGENELTFALDTINTKQEAFNKWFDTQAVLINKHVQDETVAQAKIDALNADYHKQWMHYANQREETEVRVLNGIFDQYANYYMKISGYEDEYRKNKFAWIDKEEKRLSAYYQNDVAAHAWANQEKAKVDSDLFYKQNSEKQQAAASAVQSFQQMSKLFKENSRERQAMHDLEMAATVAEIALQVQKNLMIAVGAVVQQGSGDPYTAFARIAAMISVVAGVLSIAGIAFGNGGSSAAASAAVMPDSTLLGAAAGTGSQSVANSIKLLEDTYKLEDTKLTNIYNELKDLNNNITGLVTSIVRTGSLSLEGMNLPNMGYDIGSAESAWTKAQKNMARGFWAEGTAFGDNMEKFAKLDIVGTWVNQQIGKLVGSIFGGGTETSLVASGIALGQISIDELIKGMGIGARQYADVLTKTEGGWFSSDTYSLATIYKDLDSSVTDLFTLVFKNIGSTLIEIAKGLGTDTTDVLNYVFKEAKINLQGKTTDDMNKALQEYISNISDTAVEDLFGSMLKGYQKLNEGLMETAVRLITDKEVILNYLKLTNQSFAGTIPEAIKFSETLITIAGGLDKLTDALQTYYNAFFSDAEKQAKLKEQLTGGLGMYGFDLPGTRAGYRDLVESLNLTTEAGMTAYVALMQMSKSADEYYKYLETAKGNIKPENYATYAEYMRALNAPAFAEGGYFAGGYRIVGENGPEIEFTGPSRIYSNKDSRSLLNTDELVAEIRALKQSTEAGNFANAANSAKMAKLLERWDGAGMPSDRGYP